MDDGSESSTGIPYPHRHLPAIYSFRRNSASSIARRPRRGRRWSKWS